MAAVVPHLRRGHDRIGSAAAAPDATATK